MDKHKIFFLAAIIAIFIIDFASAADIAYIVKDGFVLRPDENSIVSILKNEGHSVVVFDNDQAIIPGLYDVIIVGKDVLTISFDNKEHKTIFLSSSAAKYSGLGRYGGTTSGNSVFIQDNSHYVTQGLSLGEKAIYSENKEIGYLYGCLAINSMSLAYKSYDWKSSLLVLEKDALLLDESEKCEKRTKVLNERNLFFGVPDADKWKSDTQTLFINTVDWMLHGSDGDNDGFYYDEDCDDTNPTVNPDAEEIAYNGIDDDCFLGDLADVDSDGYCKLGYNITNKAIQCSKETGNLGTDCNDDDETINPASSDTSKNCKNDAPIISLIDDISVDETETVEIIVEAIDPEEDTLSYSINDSRFSKDGNAFTWDTGYYDSGEYTFEVTVNDGSLNSKALVNVEVFEKNQPPYCQTIPDLEWDEDSLGALNLNTYCKDDDGDSIYYYLYSTSNETSVSLASLENGTATFSSKKDWNGDDWIIFKVSDNKDYSTTNEIGLLVNPVNDPPTFEGKIPDIEWDEDTQLVDYLDLNDYFDDIDSELNFEIVGNYYINITIDDGIASFRPDKDWFGFENVVFSAKDDYNKSISSNLIVLNVTDQNEPPEFTNLTCETNILEDTSYSCELNATDFEGDEFYFSVVIEDNMACQVEGAALNYKSKKDYNGDASCLLIVSDEFGYSQKELKFIVQGVNDPPVITSFEPQESSPKVLENKDKIFKINAKDIDSNFYIKWYLDGQEKGTGDSYKFNQPKGSYEVKAEVSDSEYNVSKSWNVFVGSVSDFTCQQVNGNICAKNEICSGSNILNVLDSNTLTCCLIACSPKFEDIKRCESINDTIKININEPDANQNFETDEKINVKIEIENSGEEDLDLDVEAYLYDLTADNEIQDYGDSLDVKKDSTETLNFEFEALKDIEQDDEYAIFVKANDGDYCNENYLKIGFQRKSHELIIEDFKINPTEIECGDYLYIDTKIKNLGTKDESAYLVLENKELNIEQKTENFKIEKYDDKDEIKKTFEIQIPKDAKEGKYNLDAKVIYSGSEATASKELIVNCESPKVETGTTEIETIKIQPSQTQAITSAKGKTSIGLIAVLMILLFSLAASLVIIKYFHKVGR